MEEINKTGKNSFSVCFCIFACSAGSPPPQLPKTTRNSQSFPLKIFNPLMTNNRRHFQRRISSSPQPRLVPIPDSNTFTFIRGFGTFLFQKSSRKQSRRRKSVRGNTPAELLERKPESAILWFGISDANLSLFRYQEPEKNRCKRKHFLFSSGTFFIKAGKLFVETRRFPAPIRVPFPIQNGI